MKHTFKFMPMYWSDYDLDTQHLTTIEHGAYLLLISYYWRTGAAIPDDDILLSRVAKLSLSDWKDIKATICRFFIFEDGFWRHKRIEREFQDAKAIAERKRAAANKRWNPDNGVVIQMSESKR